MSNIIVDTLNDCNDLSLFLVKKEDECKIYRFPLGIKDKSYFLDIYKKNLSIFTKDKEIVEYDYQSSDKETIQKVNVEEVDEWISYKNDIEDIFRLDNNVPMININNFGDSYDMIIARCIKEGHSPIYLITKNIKPKAKYISKVNYIIEKGTFKKMDNPEISINCDISCVCYNDEIYIISESKFNSMFNFYKKIKDKVEENIAEVDSWEFISNIKEVKEDIQRNIRNERRFIKILNSENLIALKAKSKSELKALIMQYDSLRDKLQFNSDDTIVYNKDSLKIILDLLTNKIFISVLTGKMCNEKNNK